MKRYGLIVLLVLAMLLSVTACQPTATATEAPATEVTEAAATDATEAKETEATSEVQSTADRPTGIVEAAAWKEHYPAVVTTFDQNAEMVKTTYGGSEPYDYLETYPYLRTFYQGYVFEKQYDRARGHVYALEDVVGTARPKKGASCLACKVSEFNEALKKDESLNLANFEEYVDQHITVGFTCFDCHGETPGVVQTNRAHLTTAMENTKADIQLTDAQMSCAQCHVEYYMTKEENATTLPWTDGLGCDEAYEYYQAHDFYDWEHPQTGAKLLKAQHPETETYEGSTHEKMGADCTTCHMPQVEVEGTTIKSHHWTSPLLTADVSCVACHKDQTPEQMVTLAESVQKPVVEKTDEVAKNLLAMVEKLAAAVEAGEMSEDDLNALRDNHREAQFYWDYVFVENGEGFHNQQKQLGYLDHAQKIIDEAMSKLN